MRKKEGKYKEDKDIKITDLPGIYSLSPYTLEEVVSREFLLDGNVDVVLNIIDGSNLERNLFFNNTNFGIGYSNRCCDQHVGCHRKKKIQLTIKSYPKN